MDTSRLKLPAKIENLKLFLELAAARAAKLGFEKKRIGEIELAVEEAVVNICSYAYQNGGDIEMTCREEHGSLIIDIEDYGKPFNLLTLPGPDVTAGIVERKDRGLGVLLMKKFSDDVSYRREASKNKLSLIIRLPATNC